jgi:hypothetical protein
MFINPTKHSAQHLTGGLAVGRADKWNFGMSKSQYQKSTGNQEEQNCLVLK